MSFSRVERKEQCIKCCTAVVLGSKVNCNKCSNKVNPARENVQTDCRIVRSVLGLLSSTLML